jgi:hypothetical protein
VTTLARPRAAQRTRADPLDVVVQLATAGSLGPLHAVGPDGDPGVAGQVIAGACAVTALVVLTAAWVASAQSRQRPRRALRWTAWATGLLALAGTTSAALTGQRVAFLVGAAAGLSAALLEGADARRARRLAGLPIGDDASRGGRAAVAVVFLGFAAFFSWFAATVPVAPGRSAWPVWTLAALLGLGGLGALYGWWRRR